MQNAEVKFGPQRAEVTGPRKLHDEGFQNYRRLPRIFYWRWCGAARVAVCNFFGNLKKNCYKNVVINVASLRHEYKYNVTYSHFRISQSTGS